MYLSMDRAKVVNIDPILEKSQMILRTNPHHPNMGQGQEIVGQVNVDQLTERVEHRETE